MEGPSTVSTKEFEELLEFLKRNRGFDFRGYKRSSLVRRVRRRMAMVGVSSFGSYVEFLEVHPEEFPHLFNTILINVTTFFRDPSAWEYLQHEIVPRIVKGKGPSDAIRVWSAGCASGEEAYTLAMVIAEVLGVEEAARRMKVYATDIDDDALMTARQASYGAKEVEAVPPALLDKYFEASGNRYVFRKELRRSIIFGRHDLHHDAPISRIDLLTCRNTTMYFNADMQAKVLARLRFSLADDGYLFLGKAEMLLTHANLFVPVDLKRRIFTKVPEATLRDRVFVPALEGPAEPLPSPTNHVKLRELAQDAGPVAQVIVDVMGNLVEANERARVLFGVTKRNVGQPLRDLDVSYKPVELRSLIERAIHERRPTSVREVGWTSPGAETSFFDVQVTPIQDDAYLLGTLVTFTDVTQSKRLQLELRHSNQELETAYEELQSTSEELETTNEELQSTVEELETTNEELQSTNEELETMNEELQSTNDEQQSMNEELRERTQALDRANGFLEGILTALRVGVVVLDREMRVRVWNRHCEELWGLRADEVVGQHFLTLDIGLPVDQLKPTLRACLGGQDEPVETTLECRNRRGRHIACVVTISALSLGTPEERGVILSLDDRSPAHLSPDSVAPGSLD